jgi:hypothetical protein
MVWTCKENARKQTATENFRMGPRGNEKKGKTQIRWTDGVRRSMTNHGLTRGYWRQRQMAKLSFGWRKTTVEGENIWWWYIYTWKVNGNSKKDHRCCHYWLVYNFSLQIPNLMHTSSRHEEYHERVATHNSTMCVLASDPHIHISAELVLRQFLSDVISVRSIHCHVMPYARWIKSGGITASPIPT